MKKGKVGAAPSTDLLVCFPSRAQLALMPKPICSPARPNEASKRYHNHHLKKLTGLGTAAASPLLWTRPVTNNQTSTGNDHHHHHHHEEMSSEPTSPKVTCAGQIKVRPRGTGAAAANCRSWQSVMEEIERIHNGGSGSKKREMGTSKKMSNWGKDAMQFLTCLRNLRFDFRCFGSFSGQDMLSDDDEEEDDDDDDDDNDEGKGENRVGNSDVEEEEGSRAVFSKWFMVLQENEDNQMCDSIEKRKNSEEESVVVVPPKNALLLMRCRSAPAMSRLEEKQNQLQQLQKSDKDEQEEKESTDNEEEEEKVEVKKERETLAMVMKYDPNFYELSSDIAKETWLVDGFMTMDAAVLSSSSVRCNSLKRW